MTFVLNALLERVAIENRTAIVTQFLNPAGGFSLPGGINIGSDEGLRQLLELLKASPTLEQALAQRIATAHAPAPQPIAFPHVQSSYTGSPGGPAPQMTSAPAALLFPDVPSARQPRTRADSPGSWPKNPTRLERAITSYSTYHRFTIKSNDERTTGDKQRLYENLRRFLIASYPELGDDPWLHDVHVGHISAFLSQEALRPGKRKNEEGGSAEAAPRTMLKKVSDLTQLFDYGLQQKMTLELISADLKKERAAWGAQANAEDVHYLPFTDNHLKGIFSVETYLSANRDPKFFWCPLLGIHLGIRLGDVVRAKLANVGHIEEIDVWYIDVVPEDAKNKNSVRRLPITQPLVDLGFIRYVEHVRSLGATHLFPMWNWDLPTLTRDPSKYASRAFGLLLDAIGLRQRELVFHSFRHTVVTAMQDAGVPLSTAMQIVGHEAQDHALRTGKITESQARSVHLQDYTHADLERMGTDYPILALKSALERSVRPPIDYEGLSIAAEIVKEHVKKVGTSIRGGWATQNKRYTDKQIEALRARTARAAPDLQ